MKQLLNNTGYFFKEVIKIFKMNLLSNIFSLLSTGLIFFVLVLVFSGWWVSSQVVEVIQGEAEMSIYLIEGLNQRDTLHKVDEIKNLIGVKKARIVEETEAYDRMVTILGKEANVLGFFDENPFNSFIEVNIDLENIDAIMSQLEQMKDIDYIRDNREVLDRLGQIAKVLKLLGFLVVAAVGITTLVIVSHIIRQGIYNNKDQINTLTLLGAPKAFIAIPFLAEGILVTVSGGLLALALATVVIQQLYIQMVGPLPFIPLPPREVLLQNMTLLVLSLSIVLGVLGSLFGLASSKSK